MNIIENVQNDLSDKDWDLYTKARYLYLKSCQYFTYDHRYYYSDVALTRELFDKKIDLANVTDNRVVCGSWATQVYLPLLELIGIEGKLVGLARGHQYVEFLIDDTTIKADACGNSDLARVKFRNSTSGFLPNTRYYDYERLSNIDKELGYLNTEYFRAYFDKEILTLEEEFQDSMSPSILSYNDEYLVFKFYKIKEMLERYPELKEFSDCQFFITYLANKIFDNYDETKISRVDLYNPDSNDWNFSRLYQLNLTNDRLYFILTNPENGYGFYQVTESDARNYKSTYQKSHVQNYV